MKHYGSPSGSIVLGLVMLLASAYGALALFEDSLADTEAPTAHVSGQPLRSYEPKARGSAKSAPLKPAALVLLAPFGLALTGLGVWQVQRQGRLLRDGVPVIGYLADVHRKKRNLPCLVYRFEDEEGVVHEGHYDTSLGQLLDDHRVGQEVTVVYDPKDPRIHLLDIDDVRRADARVRRLE